MEGSTAEFAGPFIEHVAAARTPQLVTEAGDVPAGGIPEPHLRPVLALPLVSQGKLWGVLYGDMRHLFGRLNKNDRDILTLLANQAGAALENADWVSTLEQQVGDRTAQLNARVSELAIINSVQEGLVAELDLQAIFDIVGDTLTEIFTDGDVSLFTYDPVNDKAQSRYFMDEGRRISLPPLTPSLLFRYIAQSGKPFLANTRNDYPAPGKDIPGTSPTNSGMHVPLIVGDRIIGTVNVQHDSDQML